MAVDTLWAQTGYEMAWAQFELPVKNTSLIETINLSPAPLKCLEVDHKLMVEGEDFTIKFNLAFGTLDSWDYQGVSLIKSAPKLQFWRALIDNDHRLANSWKEFGLHWLQDRINQVEWELTKDKDKVVIRSKARIAPPILAWGIQVTYIYTIESTGEVTIAMQGSMEGDKPQTLPRIGLQMEIPDCFDHVSWYGRGPGEAYCDSKEANRVGVYTKKVEELYTPYIYPQENGNRHEVRSLGFRHK